YTQGDPAFTSWYRSAPHVGVLAHLLPYLEHENIYRQLQVDWNLDSPGGTGWWTNANNWTMGLSRLAVFQCPSDDLYAGVSLGTLVRFYSPPDAPFQVLFGAYAPPQANEIGLTNYLGVGGAMLDTADPYWGQWVGLFYNRSRTSLAKVPDGTSNTLLFGEFLGTIINNERKWQLSWMCAPYALTSGGLMGPREAYGAFFASRHPGVVQFCFADGSVRGLNRGSTLWAGPWSGMSPSNDWFVLQQLGGMRDGGTMDTSALVF